MPKTLILLRHAKSDWSAHVDDFDRPLNQRGRESAPRVGRWLRENGGTPQRIISSPSARTTETVQLVCNALADPKDALARVIYQPSLYLGSSGEIRRVADEHLSQADCMRVLIVGHNPGMEQAVLDYYPQVSPFADGKIMPTCALAVFEFADAGDVENAEFSAANATLRELIRPSQLESS